MAPQANAPPRVRQVEDMDFLEAANDAELAEPNEVLGFFDSDESGDEAATRPRKRVPTPRPPPATKPAERSEPSAGAGVSAAGGPSEEPAASANEEPADARGPAEASVWLQPPALPIRPNIFGLNVLWLDKQIGVAVDHVFHVSITPGATGEEVVGRKGGCCRWEDEHERGVFGSRRGRCGLPANKRTLPSDASATQRLSRMHATFPCRTCGTP